MITFQQARQLVQAALADEYPASADFTTAPWGFESSEYYVVIAGPYARLFGARNQAEEKWEEPRLDAPAITVVKATGAIVELDNNEIPNTIATCGVPNPNLDE